MNRAIVKGLALGFVAAVLTSSAHAQFTTFANFSQAGGGSKPFTFTNSGASSTFNLAVPQDINFFYQVINDYNGSSFATLIPAKMTLSATVGAVTDDLGGTLRQSLTSITMTYTADTPVNGKTNLLTIVANAGGTPGRRGGFLIGTDGGSTASFTGSQNGATGDSVTMTSDFLLFNNTTRRDYSLSLNALTPDFTLNVNGYLNNFTADATGTFATNPAPQATIPEPATLALLGLGGVVLRRRRR
ncbi:MAG: PEP-CTERM sorting domain-containing protein [Armatimonadetes bacterium]|nr:PEP-CTERM sorting domain-containing protein [Armatimonadota bacterium]